MLVPSWEKETYYLWRWQAPCGCGYSASQGINEPPMKRYDDGFQVQVETKCEQARKMFGGQVLIYSNHCPDMDTANVAVREHQRQHPLVAKL